MRQHEKLLEQERRNSLVATLVKIMRYNGASERSIQKASPGLFEFAKYCKRWPDHPAPDKQENP